MARWTYQYWMMVFKEYPDEVFEVVDGQNILLDQTIVFETLGLNLVFLNVPANTLLRLLVRRRVLLII